MSQILQYKYKVILLYLILFLKIFLTFKNNFIRLNISIICFKLGMKMIYFGQIGMNYQTYYECFPKENNMV
jgi:hypothetical protein